MTRHQVRFLPDNVKVEVEKGENLLRAAMSAEVHIEAPCGGEGTCGRCKVAIDKGEVKSKATGNISQEEVEEGYCLACLATVESDLEIRIPIVARKAERKALERVRKRPTAGLMLSPEDIETLVKGIELSPSITKVFLEIPPPSLEDNVADLSRLLRELRRKGYLNVEVDFSLDNLKKLSGVLREDNFKVTAILHRKEGLERGKDSAIPTKEDVVSLIKVEPGDTTQSNLALAMDIGTTTLHVQLVDLTDGEVIAESSDYNPQASCGEDVISRIVFSTKEGGLTKLTDLVVSDLNKLISEVLKKSERSREEISYVSVAGNTTMMHLFLGISPKTIREDPYIPIVTTCPPVKAFSLGLNVEKGTYTYIVPGRASYIGGDITAGIIGSGIFQKNELSLYIDVGTNGEIVLGNADWLVACSCSAGPAFEGGTIKHGMRATTRAIEQVRVNRETYEPMILTIGQRRPAGICGSGLIDAVAELFLSKIIDQRGKINLDLESPRIRKGKYGSEYVLVWAEESATNKDIVLSEVDIDNLIRAKGAIYAGITTLLQSVGVDISEVEQIVIAGGFGHYLELEKAVVIGFLPEVSYEKVKFIGNGSLLGARLAAISKDIQKYTLEVANKMTYLELSTDTAFMDRYVSALFLPHTDTDKFPSVMAQLTK